MTIRIVNMETQALIGVYDHEKLHRQPLFVDVELECDFPTRLNDGDLASVPDYADLEARVKERIEASHVGLVEVLGREVLLVCMEQHPAVRSAAVRIRKPKAVRWSSFAEVEMRADRAGNGQVVVR